MNEYIYHVLSGSLYYPKHLIFVTSDLLTKRTGFACNNIEIESIGIERGVEYLEIAKKCTSSK